MRAIDGDALLVELMDSDLDHLQRDDWKEVIQIVEDAPTIKVEPHWILCSDRLPEKDGRYIVSHRYLTSIVLGHPDQNVYEERVGIDSYHDGRFFYHDSAVAWWSVPVPEPYKGVTE